MERLNEVVDQLSGIGGGRQLGFGRNRVRSLPDAVAQTLAEFLGGLELANEAASAGFVDPAPGTGASLPAPTSAWLARTVTVSAGASDRWSTKLAPCPSEWAQRRPEWLPLWEPTTLIRRRSRMATPRKLICVLGFAVVVPAAG